MKKITSLLLFLLLCNSLFSQKQTSYYIGIGINAIQPKPLFLNYPTSLRYGENAEREKASSLVSPSFELGLKSDYKYFSFQLTYQLNFLNYVIHPITSPDYRAIDTRISYLSHNLNIVPNLRVNNFDLGLGPQIQYLSKPKIKSNGQESHNIKDNHKTSIGLIFQVSYNLSIRERTFILGYQYTMYYSVKTPIEIELLYNNDFENFQYRHVPDFNTHNLRLAYVFKK